MMEFHFVATSTILLGLLSVMFLCLAIVELWRMKHSCMSGRMVTRGLAVFAVAATGGVTACLSLLVALEVIISLS